MKKVVLAFGALCTLFAFPVAAAVDLQVQNVSQDNLNAVRVGANAGDVLRYEVKISGEEDLLETQVDLSNVLDSATLVNAGGGAMEGMVLSYPENFCLTCDSQEFSFFVRANKDCQAGDSLDLTMNDESVSVLLNCDGLAKSGPAPLVFAIVAMVVILASVMFSGRKVC